MRDPARHWWRRLAAFWAAGLLLALAGIPAFDALVCSDDFGARAAAVAAVTAHPDHASDNQGVEGGGGCQHGHCHHGSPAMPSSSARDHAPAVFVERPSAILTRIPPSAPLHHLMRPPKG